MNARQNERRIMTRGCYCWARFDGIMRALPQRRKEGLQHCVHVLRVPAKVALDGRHDGGRVERCARHAQVTVDGL